MHGPAPYLFHIMPILSKKDLRALVLYSPAHIDRLEKVGRLSQANSARPLSCRLDRKRVLAWLDERIRKRDATPGPRIHLDR